MISHSFSDIINTNNDIICLCHNVISYVTSYVIQQQTFSFGCRCTLSACRLPAAFFCLFSPSPCLADSILPGSLCLVDGHRPGLASSVAPQPEIHLIQSAAGWVSADAVSRIQLFLTLYGIAGWVLPSMKQGMRGMTCDPSRRK